MISIMVRIIRQVLNDKRSLAMIVVAPVFLLTLLYLLLGKNAYTPVVAVDGLPPVMLSALKSQNTIAVVPKDSEETDEDYLRNGRADAMISMKKDGIHLTMLQPDAVKSIAVTTALRDAAAKINPFLSRIMPLYYGSMGLRGVMVYGNGLSGVWTHILALCAYIAVLFAANILAVKR